ncbi:hypothetical protein PR048_006881 [Dryococelus australis]|uniref:Uncharacterized protein n=1 Tax=Dryococelus australis TaxID=614101 RepID=A0ABQ9IC78_9NEOP|nr:hypothetical protein PR048_006881 [Dryococelus australis]
MRSFIHRSTIKEDKNVAIESSSVTERHPLLGDERWLLHRRIPPFTQCRMYRRSYDGVKRPQYDGLPEHSITHERYSVQPVAAIGNCVAKPRQARESGHVALCHTDLRPMQCVGRRRSLCDVDRNGRPKKPAVPTVLIRHTFPASGYFASTQRQCIDLYIVMCNSSAVKHEPYMDGSGLKGRGETGDPRKKKNSPISSTGPARFPHAKIRESNPVRVDLEARRDLTQQDEQCPRDTQEAELHSDLHCLPVPAYISDRHRKILFSGDVVLRVRLLTWEYCGLDCNLDQRRLAKWPKRLRVGRRSEVNARPAALFTLRPPSDWVGAPPLWDAGGSWFESYVSSNFLLDQHLALAFGRYSGLKHTKPLEIRGSQRGCHRVLISVGMKGRRKWEIPEEHADQRHRSARFPQTKILEYPGRELNPVCLRKNYYILSVHADLQLFRVSHLKFTSSATAKRVRFPVGSRPGFFTCELCWTMLLVGGFFSEIAHFPLCPCIPALIHTHLPSPSATLKISIFLPVQLNFFKLDLRLLATTANVEYCKESYAVAICHLYDKDDKSRRCNVIVAYDRGREVSAARWRGRGGLAARPQAPPPRQTGFDSRGVSPGISHAAIVPGDGAAQRIFSRIFPFPPPLFCDATPYSPRSTLIGSQLLDAKNRPNLLSFTSTPRSGGNFGAYKDLKYAEKSWT